MKGKKVLVALSGGVDSSVASILLKEQGFDLIGITLRVFNPDDYRLDPLAQSIKDATKLADKLKIPYYVIDVHQEFEKVIIGNFISEYRAGRTPNPCVLCNPEIKWKNLLKIADEFDCEFISTGHYAQIKISNGRYHISKAVDEVKDQSYFLWRLNQNELKRTIFPLGAYKKADIKRIAAEKGYKTIASKKESYDICFIPEGDYRNYLKEHSSKEKHGIIGKYVTESGQVLGNHLGIENYTIGQRKGLELSTEDPLYVSKINSKDNQIVLAKKQELMCNSLIINDYNLVKYQALTDEIVIHSKMRYKSPEILSKITTNNQQLTVQFNEPVFAASPGQSIAFYEGNDLIGGGIIS